MDKNELIQFLKDNLTIDADTERGYYGEESVSITIKLGGEQIAYCYFNTKPGSY